MFLKKRSKIRGLYKEKTHFPSLNTRNGWSLNYFSAMIIDFKRMPGPETRIVLILGPPYDDGSYAGIMTFVYIITTFASLAFYISLIMVAIDIGKKLHPKAVQEGLPKQLPFL